MNIKLRAAAITLALVTGMITLSVILHYVVFQLTVEELTQVFAVGFMIAAVYGIYGIVKSRIEYAETLKKFAETR